MSDRPCNYCEWQRMKRRPGYAIASDEDVAQMRHDDARELRALMRDGWTIVVARDERDRVSFRCAFMELPDHCCC